MLNALKSLLKSRKFLLAMLAAVQSIVLNYFNVPQEVWLSISAVLTILIYSIATEDAATNSAPTNNYVLPPEPNTVTTRIETVETAPEVAPESVNGTPETA